VSTEGAVDFIECTDFGFHAGVDFPHRRILQNKVSFAILHPFPLYVIQQSALRNTTVSSYSLRFFVDKDFLQLYT
jgi:hypothetical protein